jgi:hypothetical protein
VKKTRQEKPRVLALMQSEPMLWNQENTMPKLPAALRPGFFY